MGRNQETKVVGTVTLEEALSNFSNISEENRNLMERVSKINQLVKKIVEKRQSLGLSQRDVASLTGIKQPMIARFEKCEIIPRIDTFLKIAKCLNYDLQLLDEKSILDLKFDKIKYANKDEGEIVYGFGKSREYIYQA